MSTSEWGAVIEGTRLWRRRRRAGEVGLRSAFCAGELAGFREGRTQDASQAPLWEPQVPGRSRWAPYRRGTGGHLGESSQTRRVRASARGWGVRLWSPLGWAGC